MYKLIIVDDEFGSAKAMAKFIDYEEFGFTVDGVFSSAEQALEFVEKNSIDMIISDIKMCGMTGIELLKAVNERYPRIRVILVSAYRDFEYAKEAISNNAFEYITKPVSYSEFTGALKKARDEFKKRESVAISNIDTAAGLQDKILEYFGGGADTEEIEEYLRSYARDIDISQSRCSVIIVNIPDITRFFASKWKHGSESFFRAIKQIIPINMNDIVFSFLSDENSSIRIIAVDLSRGDDYKKRLDAFISHVNYEIFTVFGLNVDISVINTANSLTELKKIGVNSTSQVFDALMFYMSRGENSKFSGLIDDFFSVKETEEQQKLCNMLTEETARREISPDAITIGDVGIKCIDKPLLLKEYAEVMAEKLGARVPVAKNHNLLKVISYISTHFSEELSLASISSHIGLTASYISHYFKQEMGESYSDFIVKVRMENAKKILMNEPDVKINTIVQLVGYKSQPYFYKAFRKYAGCLPSEYRERE